MTPSLLDLGLEAAGLGLLVLDEAGTIVECTPSATALLGLASERLVGRPIATVLCLANGGWSELHGTSAAPARRVTQVSPDDDAREHESLAVNLVQWTDPGGNRRTTVVLHRVETARELARIAQRDAIQSDHAIRGAHIGVFEYDLGCQTVSVSRIWRQMLELQPFENIDVQKEWQGRVHPDDLAAALEPIQLCGDDIVERASCEYRLLSRDKTQWRWMRTDIAVAQRDGDGKPTVLVGAQTDITERKESEEALRISGELLRTAFDYSPIGKAIVDLEGRWLRVNPALCQLLGYSEADLLTTDFQTITHADDLEADLSLMGSLLAGEVPSYTMDKRFIRANGAVMWGRLSVGLVRDSKGNPNHFLSQIVDITEERRLDELKSQFVSVVSHELRTPLTAILGSLTLLSTYDDEQFPDDIQRLLYIAQVNGERLNTLINDILDFQKFSAREMRFTLSHQPVAELVEATLMANLAAADQNGVRYASNIPDRSMVALVDPKRFHQIMANLLSNAAKFATPGTEIEVLAEKTEDAIRISVSNLGPGIPESFHNRVFTPFSQAGNMAGKRTGGTGLGLSITKQIVEQMGGKIEFDSVPEGRTTFWFTVRQAEDDQTA